MRKLFGFGKKDTPKTSEQLVKAKEEMKKAKYSPRDVNLVQDIIYWHHKITEFESDTTTDATPLATSTTQTNDR